MKTTAYITVRLDIEYDEKECSSAEEARQHAVQETPYSFPLNEKNIKIKHLAYSRSCIRFLACCL